jgi:hypothetical protein
VKYWLALLPLTLIAADLKIDHGTVAGSDLKSMQAHLSSVGIESVYGGAHVNSTTEMALVSFPDGTYLELMGLQSGAALEQVDRHYWAAFLKGNAGPSAWAVRERDLDKEVKRLLAAGVLVSAPARAGRKRPDGVELEWQTSVIGSEPRGTFFPFIIQDIGPREKRAFPQGKPTNRDFTGITRIVIGVNSIQEAISRYRSAFDLPEGRRQIDKTFGAQVAIISGAPVVFAQPLTADSWLAQRLAQFGEGPCAFILGAAHPQRYQAVSQTRWFGKDISWLDSERLGWRLGFENAH